MIVDLLRRALAPVRAGSTYRRFVHLLLGAVLLLPYVALVWLFTFSVGSGGLAVVPTVLLGTVSVAVGVGVTLVPGVRALEIAAARALLDAEIPDPDPATADDRPARYRAALWLLLNLAVGALVGLVTLTVVPVAFAMLLSPWIGFVGAPTGLAAAWLPPLGALLPLVFLHAVDAAGGAMGRSAVRFLGPSQAERLAAELAASRGAERELALRNRLARELHDSVGHALTVTTLQAGAAARVLDSDPAFVARALDAIADAGRTALEELDHVLGVLRDDARSGEGEGHEPRAPVSDLRRLETLVEGARGAGATVHVEREGVPDRLPPAVSREAYRVVQECLTNALRHAPGASVTVRVTATAGAVELSVANPAPPEPGTRNGGGRGIAGMRERLTLLGGSLEAGMRGADWRVLARLPFPGGEG